MGPPCLHRRAHQGFEALASVVANYPPARVAEICGVRPSGGGGGDLRHRSSGGIDCSAGLYQSHQATAASVAVNNMHLLRGMLGRPGAGILQMNGQPTAQNNRETGADGDLPGFRNWENEHHVAALAELWDVDPLVIPHWAEPTHAMQIFRYVEQGSISFLWIAGTNPAVRCPTRPDPPDPRPGVALLGRAVTATLPRRQLRRCGAARRAVG